MAQRAYSAVPTAITAYCQELLASNDSHPIAEAIKNQGQERTWQGINDLFEITAKNTGLEPDRLLRDLGFDMKNQDPNHIQAIFGVMRAINLLTSLGFRNIRPLRPQKSRRESDLVAEYNGTRFAIEVFRSSEAAYRFSEHQDPVHNLEIYIARRFGEKRSQLEATTKAYGCNKALLVVVMDSPPAKQLTGSDEWDGIANRAFEFMEKPASTHLLLFTGLQDVRTGRDECVIYPPLVV